MISKGKQARGAASCRAQQMLSKGKQARGVAADAKGTLLGAQPCRSTPKACTLPCASSSGGRGDDATSLALSGRSQSPLGAEVKGDDAYIMTLECEIPSCLEIGQTAYGLGVFAAMDIPAGMMIHCSKFHWIPDQEGEVLLRTQHGEHVLEVHRHFPLLGTNLREVNYFDCFTNHSCDPNVFYDAIRHSEVDPRSGDYKTFARKAIPAGAQLTCDYDLFDWDSRDKAIMQCGCGAPCCRGCVRGTLFRVPEEVVLQLADVEPITRQQFLQEHPEVLYEQLPSAGWHALVSRTHCERRGWQLACDRGAEAGAALLEGVVLAVDLDEVRTVALGIPFLEGEVSSAPQTVVFDVADIRLASAGRSSGSLVEFFGVAFGTDEAEVNAKIEFCDADATSSPSSRRAFRVVALEAIAVGGMIFCRSIV